MNCNFCGYYYSHDLMSYFLENKINFCICCGKDLRKEKFQDWRGTKLNIADNQYRIDYFFNNFNEDDIKYCIWNEIQIKIYSEKLTELCSFQNGTWFNDWKEELFIITK